MMGKDLSVVRVHNQLQLLPKLDQNLRPSYLVLVRYHARISHLAIHVNRCHNDLKLL